MRILNSACLFLLSAAAAICADPGSIVKITGGQIKGTLLDKGGAVFKGIPYAQPPVGDLRWREPMAVKPWAGVRDATAFGAICPQAAMFIPEGTISKEDCLYLNVWTPEWPSRSRKAVMVWIPGGGNFFGGIAAGRSNNDGNDGENLARHGVVVVSLNYRLGSFGFFAHPALTRESPHHASGNQGILDQIAALKWVRDNIATFGGDPRNVTIVGESAGSLDASFLMTTPLSKGLFKRVIGESGSVVFGHDGFQTLGEAEKSGEKLAVHYVPESASLTALRTASAADILKADPDPLSIFQEPLGRIHVPQAVVDGYVFLESPIRIFVQGKEHRVALLHGSNSGDGVIVPQNLTGAINEAYGPLAEQARRLYTGDADPIYGPPAFQWMSDTQFRCSAVEQLIWHAMAGNPSYQYEFARELPGGRAGAFHAQEIAYIFGTVGPGIQGPTWTAGLLPSSAIDKQISETMQQYWTNFAKTGDPNGAGLPCGPNSIPLRGSIYSSPMQAPSQKRGCAEFTATCLSKT